MNLYTALPENELTTLLKTGDEAAFTGLYHRYSQPVFAKILKMVNDRDIAKELLQDLFMKIWIQRESVDPDKSFKSYLFTIAVNLVYDHFRKSAKDKQLAQSLLGMAIDYYTHIEEALVSKENMKLIQEAIDQLPKQRRQIYMMSKLDGKSYEEISTELSVSTSTVRDHIVKANKVVKAYLTKHPDIAIYAFLLSVFIYRM